MRRGLLSFAFLWLVLLPADSRTELIRRKGQIQGESYVNLRSGPDLNHPPRAVLRRGDEVTVEGEEGSWYLISMVDGRKGYVHKTFVRLLGKVEDKEVAREQGVAEPGEGSTNDAPITAGQPVEIQNPKSKPRPIIKVLEGKEWEILWWLGAALCIFIIGWICGGNYYLRRDRIRRKRLHF